MKKYIRIFILPALLLILNSCSKDAEILERALDQDAYYINLDVLGYAEPQQTNSASDKLKSSVKSQLNKRKTVETAALADGYATLSVEQFRKSGTKKQLLSATAGTNTGAYPSADAVTAMLPGTKYMVLVFDENGKHINSTLATMGEKTSIKITGPVRETVVKHRIVAFSYNNRDAAGFPNLDPATTNDEPTLAVPVDKELLYCNTLIDVNTTADYTNETPTAIQILFYQQTAKVGLVVDARGMFSTIKRVTGTYSSPDYFKTGVLNLKGNSIGTLSTVATTTLDFGEFNATAQDTAVFYRYTLVDPTQATLPNFGVDISELVVERNGIEKILIANTGAAKPYDFELLPLAHGTQTDLRINLLEGFPVGNLMWAKANLYYDATADEKYKFRQFAYEGNGAAYKETDFWRPDNLLPSMDGAAGDPCAQVYPKGWRLPTQSEATILINDNFTDLGITQLKEINTNGRSIKYASTDLTNTSDLTFYTAGYYSAVNTLISRDLYAGFLTSYRPANNDLSVLAFTTPESGGTSTDVITYYGNVGSRRFNIRCVRALN